MKKLTIVVGLLFSQATFGQFVCPGNLWTNGEANPSSAIPNGSSDNLSLASGFSGLRTANAQGEVVNTVGAGTNPNPMTGSFITSWISSSNYTAGGQNNLALYREGFKNLLSTPLNPNSTYQFSLDVANSFGWGTAEIGIYGSNHAPGTYVTPTAAHVPTNMAMYGAGNTFLIGTIQITPATPWGTMTNYTFTFTPSALGFNSTVNHIFITNSDAQISGIRYCSFDNFCLTEIPTEYCCDNPNLLANGNFEQGNTGFNSGYSNQPTVGPNSLLPGEYSVLDVSLVPAINSFWDVLDHTQCITGINSTVMVVNGRTQQPIGTETMVYSQDVGVDVDREYLFCMNVNYLLQCNLNVDVRFRVEIQGANWTAGSPYQGGVFTINSQVGSCDWQLFGGNFIPTQSSVVFSIFLLEDGQGDGNDFAFDDIYMGLYEDPCHLEIHPYGGEGESTGAKVREELKDNQENVIIYPNPSKDIFTISMGKASSGKVIVTDLAGRIILTDSFEKISELECDLTSQKNGNYLVKIFFADREVIKMITKE